MWYANGFVGRGIDELPNPEFWQCVDNQGNPFNDSMITLQRIDNGFSKPLDWAFSGGPNGKVIQRQVISSFYKSLSQFGKEKFTKCQDRRGTLRMPTAT